MNKEFVGLFRKIKLLEIRAFSSTISTMKTSEKYTLFFGKDSPFSQHHSCTFTIDGVTYNCAEQYMMHQKAAMFGDKAMEKQILATSDPKMQKKYGRKVENFVVETWSRMSRGIVKEASMAKFSQDPKLLQAIKATQGTVLVECSPRDRLWGIGLGKKNPKAHDKSNWRGKNLLGYILTEVRDALMKRESKEEKSQESSPQQGVSQTIEKSFKIEAKKMDSTAGSSVKKSKKAYAHVSNSKAETCVRPKYEKACSKPIDSKAACSKQADIGKVACLKQADISEEDTVDTGHESVVTDAVPGSDDEIETKTVDKLIDKVRPTVAMQSEPHLGDADMETNVNVTARGKIRKAKDDGEEPSSKRPRLDG